MARFSKPVLAALLLVYFFLHIFTLGLGDREELRWHERMVVYATAPAQKALDAVANGVVGVWTGYVALVRVAEKNEVLSRERDRLLKEMTLLEEVRRENDRLRRLFQLPLHHRWPFTMAERIGSGATPYERTMRVSRGMRHGIQSGFPVVSDRGVVGQVLKAYDHSADVLLLTDSVSAIDVMSQRSRERGILRGDRSDELRFEYVLKTADLSVGDTVITSGLDGIYPEGQPVGVITSVKKDVKGLFLKAKVRPVVDFLTLEEVSILHYAPIFKVEEVE